MSVGTGSIVISGPVLDVVNRRGTNDNGPWEFNIVTVLVGKTTQEVRFDRDSQCPVPSEGDNLAVEVRLSVYRNMVQASAIRNAAASPVASVPNPGTRRADAS